MNSSLTGEQSYYPQLDALRFFAVIGVMIVHNWRPKGLPWLLADLDWGNFGVRLFFVLSGFLITGILIRCRDLAETTSQPSLLFIRQFYIRRFLRIFPIYYLTIAIALIFNIPGARDVWAWLLTYTTNIYITINNIWIGRMGHFWSLAVEEHFYLIWPWLVLFAPKKWLIPAMLIAIPIGPLFRAYAFANFPFDIGAMDFKAGTLTPGLLDSLGIGALLALIWHSHISKESLQKYLTRGVLPIAIVGYIICLLLYHYRIQPSIYFILGDFSLALIFMWLISSAAIGFKGIGGWILNLPPLVYLGKIAYGIYVYHNIVPLLIIPVFEYFNISLLVPGRKLFLVSSLITFALASFSWHLFELPINNLKRYFPYYIKPTVKTAETELISGES